MKQNEDEVIYQLVVGDIQDVATESFGRELSSDEIRKVLDPIGEMIPWRDIIENCIILHLNLQKVGKELE